MTIAFPCENCGHRFEVDGSLAGKKCKCKKCNHVFVIPTPRVSSTPPAAKAIQSFGDNASAPKPKPKAKPKAAPAKPAASAFDPYYTDDDPYGFDDKPEPSRTLPDVDEDEEFIPRQTVKPGSGTTSRKKKKSSGSFFENIPSWAYLALGGAFLILVIGAMFSKVMFVALTVIAFLVSLVMIMAGSIGILVVPFLESAACGLLNIFVPFYTLYYVATRWDAMKRWFLLYVSGLAIFLVFFGVALFLPAINAARQAALKAQQRDQMARGIVAPGAQGDRMESRAADVIRTTDEICDLLQGVTDVPSAQAASHRFFELTNHLDEVHQFQGGELGDAMNKAGFMEQLSLNASFGAEIKRVNARHASEMNRVRSLPGVFAALQSQSVGFANNAPLPGRLRRFNRGPGAGPSSMPPPPAAPGNSEEQVKLIVNGLVDQETRDVFYEKLDAHAQTFRNGNGGRRSNGSGNVDICVVWPIKDAQAFADGISFAKVTKVNGRTITLKVPPLQGGARRPAASDFVAQVLFDLKSPALNRRKDALRRLREAPPDPARREEVAKAIEPLLHDPDGFARGDAAQALGVWGGPENTQALTEALKDTEFNVGWAVLDALKKLHDPAAAEAVAAMLPEQRNRHKAAETLKAMGPEAQAAVVPYLDHSDVFVRMDACKILAVIGTTDETRLAIMNLWRKVNGQGLDAMAADDAIRKIGKPKVSPFKKKSIVPK